MIGYISDAVKATTNGELPIVAATPATLREALNSLIDDRDGTAAIGRASMEFARTYHDGRWTAQVLSGFLK